MSQNVTTTQGHFKVHDVTFRGARRQSEIENEIERPEEDNTSDIPVPVSLTPEQVKMFYLLKIKLVTDSNEKRVYAQTIKWIDEMLETRKKLIALEAKEVVNHDDTTNTEI